MKQIIGIALFLCLFVGFTTAQTTKKKKRFFSYELSGHYGKVADIHPFFPSVNPSGGVSLTLIDQTSGRKSWHQVHNYPSVGVELSYVGMGNPDTLGYAISVRPLIQFEKTLGQRFKLIANIGIGLAWSNKYFDAETNPGNYVIGTQITASPGGNARIGYQITDKIMLSGGVIFKHYSNGHFRVPNIGANKLGGYLGLRYTPNEHKEEDRVKHELGELNTQWRINVALGLGVHEVEGTVLPYDGPQYPVYALDVYTSKRLNRKGQLLLGVNLNYYAAFHDFIVNQQVFLEKQKQKSYKGIIYGGYEVFLGRFSVAGIIGVNAYFPLQNELIDAGRINKKFLHTYNSNRLSFNYYLKETINSTKYNPYIGFGWKTIGGKADFIEFRTGIGL